MTQDERDPFFLWSPVNSLKGTLISEFPVDCIICIHINFPNRCHLPGSSNCFSLTPSFSCCPPYLEYWNLEKEIGSVLCAATLVSWNLELVSLTLVAYLQGKSFLFFFVCRSLPIKIIFCSCLCFSRVWNLVCFTTVSSLLFLIEVLVH